LPLEQTVRCIPTSILCIKTNSQTVAAVDQDELDALDDLKHTNEIVTSSLTNELQLLQTRHKNLIIDFDQQRAHLVESLLDRENLRKDLEAARKARPTPINLAEDGRNTADGEKAKTALQEVSREYHSPKEKSSGKQTRPGKIFRSLLSPRSRNKPDHSKCPVPSGIVRDEAAKLAWERQTGFLKRVQTPDK
jgi:hypothetical protein